MSPTRKSTARKKATAKKATRKRGSQKSAARKKATKKPTQKKTTQKKATRKASGKATKKKTTQKKATRKSGKGASAAPAEDATARPSRPPKPGPLVVARGKKVSKLGIRWTCWSCHSAFYDLNKPAPICPRCQTDQRVRPETEKGDEPPRKRDTIRALRVLDDEDTVEPSPDDETEMDLDLELGADEKLLDETDDEDDED